MKLKLIKIIEETHDTKTFRFIPEKNFDFKAGQFIVFIMNDKEGEFRRAFSIANSPDEKEFIEITAKRAPNGKASLIFFEKTKINDIFEALGPYGLFIYNNENVKHIIHIAAGSGIVPIRSIIKYITKNKPEIKQTLLYSNKTLKDIIYKKEFDVLNINKIYTITRNEGEEWKGKTGRITKDIIKEHIGDNDLYFICGPPEFVNNMVLHLKELGIGGENIKTERYD
ncbi:oxidoreductase [Candidatus Woesearchaeota archaeon]|nr:oxidoreductase [Candidatus Woesearchaeota archaeon]